MSIWGTVAAGTGVLDSETLQPFPIVATRRSIILTRYSVVAVYCIAVCEWVEALPKEVILIWPSQWNSIKIAYFLCRYYTIVLWPIVIYAYDLNHSIQLCSRLMLVINYILLPMQCFAHAVMLMRAYGFTGRNFKALILLCTCLVGLVGVNIWFFCIDVPKLPDVVYVVLGAGCFPDYAADVSDLRVGLEMAAAIFMDLVSLLVIIVYRIRKRDLQGSLSRAFLNQGLSAFAFMVVVHATAIGSYYKSVRPIHGKGLRHPLTVPSPRLLHNGMGLPYILILSNVMACRVILDLRNKARPTESEIERQHSALIEDELANYQPESGVAASGD
ncbi:unnamed protein product [Mycena citricolor]|uniref:DUF6533 domain-containing protein n=1 Tax=Mycena citricolor TaxID=2018698 RepID=A0AAD2JVF6_9AGAR|nr:unnamed protein product [Mycena citricolor]